MVQIEGKLQDTLGSRQGRVSFAEIDVTARVDNPVETLRHEFMAGVHSALPEPQSSFGLGLLIGDRSGLPAETTAALSAVGLTHIIAVSGYNLTILVNLVRRLLAKRSKYQATIGALALVTGFVLVTGFSASIVRAAVVSLLSIGAWYYGRTFRPVLLLVFVAALTAIWNPLYVWGDAGWWLSFLAFYGVLVLAPALQGRLPGAAHRGMVGMLLLETLSAQVMTMPYILYLFHQVAIFAVPANLAVVPLVPVAMVLTLLAGLAGMFFATLVGWFAWPAKILLTYMLDMATVFARIPHASISRTMSLFVLLSFYACLLLVSLALSRQHPRDTITDIK
jgi:competence protein ComEC